MSDESLEQPHAFQDVPNETTATNVPAASSLAPAHGSARAYILDTRRERTATEIMMFGWLNLRPLSDQELEYWNTHLLPTGCSIIQAPNAALCDGEKGNDEKH